MVHIDANRINTYHNYGQSLFQGLFCSVSAINNAGFTIFKHILSLDAFRNDGNAFFTFLIICELTIGGIGYPLIFDIIEKVKYKRKKMRYKISLFTKVALLGFICVTIAGLAMSFGFEYGYKDFVGWNGNIGYKDIAYFKTMNNEFGKADQFNRA
jgi:Trk-type K+ transport system membrane component